MTEPISMKSAYPYAGQFSALFLKSLIAVSAILLMHMADAQTLNLSTGGQTGISGTNWSTSGTNPVTITTTGAANINTSVIEGYLNTGVSVVVSNGNNLGIGVNSNISKTSGGNASLTLKDVGLIKIGTNISISSTAGALDIIVWADADNSQGGAVDDYVFCDAGATLNSNGGKIVIAGGADNGNNGGVNGDGIPDNFAWNGSNSVPTGAINYGGLTLGPLGGTGTVISLLSAGGEIILRGSTSNNNGLPGITSQGNLKIVSGTGKITMYGKSTTGHGIELTFGAAPSIVISSSSTSVPAIDLKGTTSVSGFAGFWTSNNGAGNTLIQSNSASGGGITIEGYNSSSGAGLWFAISLSNIVTQLISQSGPINLKGDGGTNSAMLLYGDLFIGNRKDATAIQGITPTVTSSTANILIQADEQITFSNTSGKNTNINSTGSLTVEAYSAGFSGAVSWTGNSNIGSGFSSITLGESAENYGFIVSNTLTTTGNITAYATDFTLANGVGLVSSGAGTINVNAKGNFNTLGSVRRTISTVNGNIDVFADSDANGSGQLDIDFTTFNPGTGATRLRAETMLWLTASSTDKPYVNGTGAFIFEPSDASFSPVSTVWFFFDQDANGLSGLTIGKPSNTGNVLHEINSIAVAGPVSFYGGMVSLSVNLTSSANGDIFIKSNSNLNGAASIAASSTIQKTAGTGTLTMQSQDRLNTGTITASGTGILNVVLWSDYDNDNNGGVTVNSISTNGGHLWLGGSNSNGGTYTWKGLAVGNGPSVGNSNNNYNAIDFNAAISTNGGSVLVWGGNGFGGGTAGIAVYPGASINSGSGDITLVADNISLNDLAITSTGVLSLVPDGGSYPAAITWSGSIVSGNFDGSAKFDNLFINNFANLGGLCIGFHNAQLSSGVPVVLDNSSAITVGSAISLAGPVKFYSSGGLTISQNIASTGGGEIGLIGNTLSIAGAAAISSTGNLVIEPVTAATTIGLAGGAGTLAVTAANFSTNFSDGFSEIRIGNTAAGNITLGAATTLRDKLQLSTSGNLLLNEILDIGANDFRFIGGIIVPASNKFVKTNGVGRLRMDINASSSKLFPLGISFYNPVTITNNIGAGDVFSATVSNNVFTNGGGTPVIWSPRINLTWGIGNTAASTGAGNADLSFGWNAANITGTLTSPKLLRYAGPYWTLLPGSPSVNLGAGTLTYSGYAGVLTSFAIAESNAALPVNWLSFTGKKLQNDILLEWITGSEINNAYYEVERGNNGSSFTRIAQIAVAINPDVENSYRYTDQQPLKGRSYYRIKQVDRDGSASYSDIVSIGGIDDQGYRIVTIAGADQLLLTTPQSLTGNARILIYDGNGRLALQQQALPGRNVMFTGSILPGGVYYIKVVQSAKLLFSSRFIKR